MAKKKKAKCAKKVRYAKLRATETPLELATTCTDLRVALATAQQVAKRLQRCVEKKKFCGSIRSPRSEAAIRSAKLTCALMLQHCPRLVEQATQSAVDLLEVAIDDDPDPAPKGTGRKAVRVSKAGLAKVLAAADKAFK